MVRRVGTEGQGCLLLGRRSARRCCFWRVAVGVTVAAVGPVCPAVRRPGRRRDRSEEHTSELQSLMRISYAVFCLKKKKNTTLNTRPKPTHHSLYTERNYDRRTSHNYNT